MKEIRVKLILYYLMSEWISSEKLVNDRIYDEARNH